MTAVDTTTEEYRANGDKLIYMLEEAHFSRDEVVAEARKLFPAFNDVTFHDVVIGPYEIEVYKEARGKGLSIEEAAHVAEVSNYVVQRALIGEGVSLERFVELLKAELFSTPHMVSKLLGIIDKAESQTSVSAAALLLEKIAPNRYGKAAGLTTGKEKEKEVVLNFSVSDD